MAVNPGTYNFVLQRGADWSVLLQFKDSNNDAVDLTGATIAAQAWNQPGTKVCRLWHCLYKSVQRSDDNQLDQHANSDLPGQSVLRRTGHNSFRDKRVLLRRRNYCRRVLHDMTSVNVTTQKNTVSVSTSGQLTTVTATTAGPQGPPGDFDLVQSSKVDKSVIYYDQSADTFRADNVYTAETLTDGGSF